MAVNGKKKYDFIIKNIGKMCLLILGIFYLYLIYFNIWLFINKKREGIDETPEEKQAREESERITEEEKKKAADIALHDKQVKKFEDANKEIKRLEDAAAKEIPAEITEDDLVKPIVIPSL